MGLIHVPVSLQSFERTDAVYEANFLVDTGATDSMAPTSELRRIGVSPVGRMAYELADGSAHEYQIERVIRREAQEVGVDPYRYMSATGAIHWATLDQLLEQKPVRELLAQLRPDLPKELVYLLTDGRGLNLRHDVAHGILRPGASVRGYALLSILILLTLSVFSASGPQAPESKQPESPV